MKVVITEWMDSKSLAKIQGWADTVLYHPDLWKSPKAWSQALSSCEILLIRNQTPITSAFLDQCPSLSIIGRLGVGLDNIDLKACHDHEVRVIYARAANAPAVVEYVLACMLASVHPWLSTPLAWPKERQAGGRELMGKTLGIVGLGDIGGRVARLSRHLGMTTLVYDPHLLLFHPLIIDRTVTPVASLEALLSQSDIVTLHAALRPDTIHLLDAHTLSSIKKGATLINTARGQLIDEGALLAALQSGQVGQAFLDVREHEPPTDPDPLQSLPNVTLTPHIAGLTVEALERTTDALLDDMTRLLTGRRALGEARWWPS